MNSRNNLVKERQKIWVLGFILVIGSGLTLLAFYYSMTWEQRAQQFVFQQRLESIVASLNKELSTNISVLLGLNSFFQSSQHVEREEFSTYTRSVLSRYDTIQALEWVPKIAASERENHEQQARNNGLTNYKISQDSPDGMLHVTDKRDDYFPVFYIEPLSGNEGVIGFDLGSNTSRLALLQQSAVVGEAQASSGIELIQGELGVLIAVPLFKGEPQQLLGFTVGVYRIERMISQVFKEAHINFSEYNLEIIDNTPAEEPLLLFSTLDAGFSKEMEVYTADLFFAGRNWMVSLAPSTGYLNRHTIIGPWLILVAGLLLTLLLTHYVRVLRYREAKVSYLVEQRTKELELSERTTNTIIDSAVTAVITINKYGTVQRFNPAAEKIFGYTSHEVIGNNVKILMPAPYHLKANSYLQDYGEAGDTQIIGTAREVRGQRKNGELFPALLAIGAAKVDSDPIYVATVLDITLQKEAEQALIKAKNTAERANKQKSEFLNMMNHELRTPLTVILGYLPILKKADALPAPDLIAEIASDMDQSGQHLLTLINDLLDLSKIESGSMSLVRQSIVVSDAVTSVIGKLKKSAEQKHIEIKNIANNLTVSADPLRLQQILINLIGNAIKFTQQGTITVETKETTDFVEISVADTGSGIAEENLAIIFEKFEQIDCTSTRNRGGSGLGLAITRQLVELHGGQLTVTSRLGEGSCFSFTIPVNGGNE